MKEYYKLVLITQKLEKDTDEYLDFLKGCIQSGVTSIQLREKNLNFNDAFSLALHLKEFLSPFKIPLIINDNLDLALKTNAEGLHLGQGDGDVIHARKALGPNKILGQTVNCLEQLVKANKLPVNYVGIGPVFPTKNKPHAQKIWGCQNLKKVVSESIHKVIAIGGIDLNNARDVVDTGVHGIAAIGVFHNSSDPGLVTRNLFNLMRAAYS